MYALETTLKPILALVFLALMLIPLVRFWRESHKSGYQKIENR